MTPPEFGYGQETQIDATDDEQKSASRRLAREASDIQWLMGHAPGRRIVARLFEHTGIHRTSYSNSGSAMAFNEGKRTVGLWLLGEVMSHAPDAYLKLLKDFRDAT